MQIYNNELTKTELSRIFSKDQLLIINYTEKKLGKNNIFCKNQTKTIGDAIKLLSKFKESCLKDIQAEEMPLEGIDFYVYSNQEAEYIKEYAKEFSSFYKRLYLFKVNNFYTNKHINYTRVMHQNRFINFINFL